MAAHPSRKPKTRYVLIIEDNVHHAELLTEVLDHHFAPVVIHTVDTIESGIEFASQSNYDLIITAGVLKDKPVTTAIPELNRSAGGTPIVVISGRGDERLAAEFIKKGASEYLGKTRETLDNLPALLGKHLSSKSKSPRRMMAAKSGKQKEAPQKNSAIMREVDLIAQEALAIVGPRRRKRRTSSTDADQLDRLLGQIKRLRELASKISSKG